MGIFRRLEDFLERLVEAPAGRIGASLQPVTLAKRITRAMDSDKRFTENGTIVPNRFTVLLNPRDHAPFAAYHASLEDDLAHEALNHARRQGYRLVARPRVEVSADPHVPRGDVRVAARVADVGSDGAPFETPSEAARLPAHETAVLAHGGPAAAPHAGRAWLVVQTDGAAPARFELGGTLIAIGRAPDNDVVLDDPQASRYHCQLTIQHGAYRFVDLQSRNGSVVNQQPVTEIALADGDRIRVGSTSITFRVHP